MLRRKMMAQMTRTHCHKGQYLYSTFPTPIIRKPARLQCTRRHARVISSTLPGEMSRFARVMMI